MAVLPAYHESLPYIDPEPSPEALAAARALVTAEQTALAAAASAAPVPGAHPSLPAAPLRRFTPALATELARIAAGAPPQPLSLSRYEAQELLPPASSPLNTASLRPVLERAYVAASYLSARAQNLMLLERHGPAAWLLANHVVEQTLRHLEADLVAARRDLDQLNARRAAAQNTVRAELFGLQDAWRRSVARILDTEVALQNLRAQIRDELRSPSSAATITLRNED